MSGKKKLPLLLALSASFVLGAVARPACAETVLTPVEWVAMPVFCKVAFQKSAYVRYIPADYRFQREAYGKHDLSTHGIPGAHHFCMGMVELNRAKRGNGSYEKAVEDFAYSQGDMEPNAPMFSYVNAYLGRALYLTGKRSQAAKVWMQGITIQPKSRESYLAMAEAMLSEHRPQEALTVLQKFDEAKEAEYPDAEHFMAQTYFELKQYDEAKKHAEKAYELGYPVYGLRDKMKRIGKW